MESEMTEHQGQKYINPSKTLSFHQKRSYLRKTSKIIDNRLYQSLQTCRVEHNLVRLRSLQNVSSSKSFCKRMDAVICILETLLMSANYNNTDIYPEDTEVTVPLGILDFKTAAELYADITEIPLACRVDDLQTRLKDDLLHDVHGIRCVIFTNHYKKTYIILDSDYISVASIFKKLCEDEIFEHSLGNHKQQHTDLDYVFVQNMLKTLDSEHDKNVFKGLLGKILTYDSLVRVGIRPETAQKSLKKLELIQYEVNNSVIAATDMMNLRLNEEIRLKQSKLDCLVQKDVSHLSQMRKSDVELEIEMLEESIKQKHILLLHEDQYSSQKFKQAVNRLAKKLIRDNRVKSRRLGAGPKPLLDSSDEQFIADAIESKSSAHGRRHDSVLYLNHRVKSRDLLSIANYNLLKRGKRMIKSARTVSLRARPRRVNTIEGRKHKGHWLFCTKKPPKTEDHETELTHHQRAHIKLNRTDMFGSEEIFRSSSLEVSFDDKAYVRPGTDVGFRDTKSGKILQVTDENKQRKLPQHDFGTPEVYQTPSSFRVMTWRTETINGEDKLVKDTDHSHVVIRPKYYVGSSGCVWGSDLIRLRYEDPDIFETKIQHGQIFSKQNRTIYAMTRDSVFHYKDCSTEEDFTSLKHGGEEFKNYEEKKLSSLQNRLNTVLKLISESNEETPISTNIIDNIKSVNSSVQTVTEILQVFDYNDPENITLIEDKMKSLLTNCEKLLDEIDGLNLPSVRPIIAEYTDAGPGVGINNLAVRFRFAELCRIQNSVRRVRIHRACGDSAQNEAERTNSAIGDALVDGASLHWDYYKAFDGLSEEEIQHLSTTEVDSLKAKALKKNAWAVAKEICHRIDDARDPSGGYLHAHVTEYPDDHFFWNGTFLKRYCDSSKAQKMNVPGHGYFKKIFDFISTHIESGELYMEYRKNKCENSGSVCNFCENSPTLDIFGGSQAPPVPRPYPDYHRLPNFHYLPYNRTPIQLNGKERNPDDYQPRANLRKMFNEGTISSNQHDKITEFSEKFIVPTELVEKYISHLETLKLEKDKRLLSNQQKRQDEVAKTYADYDWINMFENNLLDKQTVSVLDKYIEHHKLGYFQYKLEKVQAVKRSIASSIAVESDTQDSDQEDASSIAFESETQDSDQEDLIIEGYDSESNETENDTTESDSDINVERMITTRSTRQVRLPSRYLDYVT